MAGRLTPKELTILTDLATTGASNEEIAERHGMRVSTVRTHIQNILLTTATHSKVELVVFFWTQLHKPREPIRLTDEETDRIARRVVEFLKEGD
jgi:DNA-binding CsgD family transcriptional regulator